VDAEQENLRVFEALQQADLNKVESPLGKKHRASDWLEDGGENEYFLDTDGTFYAYEGGAPVPLVQLNQEDVERLSGK
jgi:hypothetical protein